MDKCRQKRRRIMESVEGNILVSLEKPAAQADKPSMIDLWAQSISLQMETLPFMMKLDCMQTINQIIIDFHTKLNK